MKKIKLIFLSLCFCVINSHANTHIINSGNMYFNPSSLTINTGDTVVWINDGGFHNVNFNISSISGNTYNNPVIQD